MNFVFPVLISHYIQSDFLFIFKGPATVKIDGEEDLLVGVNYAYTEMYTGRCGDKNEFSLFTSVYAFKTWIKEKLSLDYHWKKMD